MKCILLWERLAEFKGIGSSDGSHSLTYRCFSDLTGVNLMIEDTDEEDDDVTKCIFQSVFLQSVFLQSVFLRSVPGLFFSPHQFIFVKDRC